MDKQGVYDFLNRLGVWFEVTEHTSVYNMAELANVPIPYPEADAKNLFIRDDKKQNYYLLTVRGDRRVDLKAFRRAHGLRPISFASAEELAAVLGLYPGAVTPLGVLNDAQARVKVFLDSDFFTAPGLVGAHPNDNTATVWLRTEDLAAIIREHGNELEIEKF